MKVHYCPNPSLPKCYRKKHHLPKQTYESWVEWSCTDWQSGAWTASAKGKKCCGQIQGKSHCNPYKKACKC